MHDEGGVLSLGSLAGFCTVLGIAARNGIMLVSHYRHLQESEGVPFGRELVIRGAEERLAPILMTALATGLALVPIVIGESIRSGSRTPDGRRHPRRALYVDGTEGAPASSDFPAVRSSPSRPPRPGDAL